MGLPPKRRHCATCRLWVSTRELNKHALTAGHPVYQCKRCKVSKTSYVNLKTHEQCCTGTPRLSVVLVSQMGRDKLSENAIAAAAGRLTVSDAIISETAAVLKDKLRVAATRSLVQILAAGTTLPEGRNVKLRDINSKTHRRHVCVYVFTSKHIKIAGTDQYKVYIGQTVDFYDRRSKHSRPKVAARRNPGWAGAVSAYPLTDDHWTLTIIDCKVDELDVLEELAIAQHYGVRHETDMYHRGAQMMARGQAGWNRAPGGTGNWIHKVGGQFSDNTGPRQTRWTTTGRGGGTNGRLPSERKYIYLRPDGKWSVQQHPLQEHAWVQPFRLEMGVQRIYTVASLGDAERIRDQLDAVLLAWDELLHDTVLAARQARLDEWEARRAA